MPKACYLLAVEAKKMLLEWVKKLQLPDRYALNLSRCVDLKELKMSGVKIHDSHVFMEWLLPIALRIFLPLNVWNMLIELSLLYTHMKKLEFEIPVLILKLEKIFPPSFFDIMEYLMVHLPYKAHVCDPVQYRWMHSLER
jgi:hypothetical protein